MKVKRHGNHRDECDIRGGADDFGMLHEKSNTLPSLAMH